MHKMKKKLKKWLNLCKSSKHKFRNSSTLLKENQSLTFKILTLLSNKVDKKLKLKLMMRKEGQRSINFSLSGFNTLSLII